MDDSRKAAMQLAPFKAEHVSVFLEDELNARGWSRVDLAKRMGGDILTNLCALDFLYWQKDAPRESAKQMYLGGLTSQFARAFEVSENLFRNLEKSWRLSQGYKP